MGLTLGCGVWASRCSGFSCDGACALGAWASGVVAHGLSCSEECGLFPDQELNQYLLHCKRILNHCTIFCLIVIGVYLPYNVVLVSTV